MENGKEYWNQANKFKPREEIKYDDWLDEFLDEIKKCQTPIIDLGCGKGNDTKYLLEHGKEVIPCDFSDEAIKNIKVNFPEIERTECFDLSDGLPFPDNFTDIVIADLSLHYFTFEKTFEILQNIKRILKPSGLLLFRVNSIDDVNYGAGQGNEIEKHLYETRDGRYKRFFDKEDIELYFHDWSIICATENTMMRYQIPKRLWKCAVKKA